MTLLIIVKLLITTIRTLIDNVYLVAALATVKGNLIIAIKRLNITEIPNPKI